MQHGPLVGILGALVAPFLVGGSSDAPELFYYFFGLIAVAALLIDALRRWAWVSVLGLGGAFLAATYIFALGAGDAHYLGFGVAMVLAGVILPQLKVTPAHNGMMVIEILWRNPTKGVPWPEFPTRLAFGAIAAGTGAALLVALSDPGETEVWLALMAMLVIYGLVVIWSRGAQAISDAALFALPVLVFVIAAQAGDNGSLFRAHLGGLAREPETGPPWNVSLLAAAGVLVSVLALWRGLFDGRHAKIWAAGAALAAPWQF